MTTARNATLEDLISVLKDQQARKHDIVVPATALRARNGSLVVKGAEPELTADGVTTVDGIYRPTQVCDEGLASKLGIPVRYLNRLRSEAPDLYDANVNGWLHGRTIHRAADTEVIRAADPRSFLLRCFRGDGYEGVARALLSDSYRTMDNLDVLTAALDGIRRSGTEIEVHGCNLTDSRMYVDIAAPAVAALAPILLGGYRNPFDDPAVDAQRARNQAADIERWRGIAAREGMGYTPGSEPVVFAGFRLSNSEVGGGAFSITPKLIVKICRNGLTVTQDAIRNVHLGGKLEEGIVEWSHATHRKALDLIAAKTADAVSTFLDANYLTRVLTRIEERAGKPITAASDVIRDVAKALRFTEAERDGVFDHFIRGGQITSGGVLNAVTSFSQTVADADRADELDSQALKVLDII